MTDYERWEAKHKEQMMDAPFPPQMMPCIEQFFKEVHPKLRPGEDFYQEVFDTELFFPLQRQQELAQMMRIARKVGPPCEACDGTGMACIEEAKRRGSSEVKTHGFPCSKCQGNKVGPRTVMEIGADKGGGLYHWCMCLPTVKNVIGFEIRGTPYSSNFESAFSGIRFYWGRNSQNADMLYDFRRNVDGLPPIDVLFIDGDKLGMVKDFQTYLLMMANKSVVFVHDIADNPGPRQAWEEIIAHAGKAGWKTEVIFNLEDTEAALKREAEGIPSRSSHEGWLRHWKGRSCRVGVVHINKENS